MDNHSAKIILGKINSMRIIKQMPNKYVNSVRLYLIDQNFNLKWLVMRLKRSEKLSGPDLPAADRDAHPQVGVVRAEDVLPVTGTRHPGMHNGAGQGLAVGGGQVGTLPDVFPPAIDGAGVKAFEPLLGSEALGIGVAEEPAPQHVIAIGLRDL